MNDTICGHERESLRWALKTKTQLETGWIPFTMGGRISPNESYNKALTAIGKPDKLAEIIAELIRKCGLPVLGFNESSSWSFASVGVVDLNEPSTSIASGSTLGIRVETVHVPDNGTLKNGKLTMWQARSLAQALLDGMTASDIANMTCA